MTASRSTHHGGRRMPAARASRRALRPCVRIVTARPGVRIDINRSAAARCGVVDCKAPTNSSRALLRFGLNSLALNGIPSLYHPPPSGSFDLGIVATRPSRPSRHRRHAAATGRRAIRRAGRLGLVGLVVKLHEFAAPFVAVGVRPSRVDVAAAGRHEHRRPAAAISGPLGQGLLGPERTPVAPSSLVHRLAPRAPRAARSRPRARQDPPHRPHRFRVVAKKIGDESVRVMPRIVVQLPRWKARHHSVFSHVMPVESNTSLNGIARSSKDSC